MNFDGAQVVGLAAAAGSIITGLGAAALNGLFGLPGQTRQATKDMLDILQKERDTALVRLREAEEDKRVHHAVINDARMKLFGIIYQDDLNDYREELKKLATNELNTRIR